MQMWKKGLGGLAGIVVAMSQAWAQPVVIFGDSLSDIGQTGWASPATFLTPEGKPNWLWSQHFAKAHGETLVASSKGGTDYAYSSGVINPKDVNPQLPAQPQVVVGEQLKSYLARGVKPEAVHVLFVGGNDMDAMLTQALTSANPQALIQSRVMENAKLYAQAWGALRQAGVQTLVVPDVPNVMQTPSGFKAFVEGVIQAVAPESQRAALKAQLPAMLASLNGSVVPHQEAARKAWLAQTVTTLATGTATPTAQQVQAVQPMVDLVLAKYDETMAKSEEVTTIMNLAMTQALNQVGGNLVRLPLQAMFNDIVENPEAYGLANASGYVCAQSTAQNGPCQPYGDAKQGSALIDGSPAPESFVFADSFHPGPKVHQILSDWMNETLKAPARLSLVGEAMSDNAEKAVDSLIEQNTQWVGSAWTPQGSQAALRVGASQWSMVPSIYAGGAMNVAPGWQASLWMGHQSSRPKRDGVEVRLHAYTFSGALRRDWDNAWLGSYVQAASHHGVETRSLVLAGLEHRRNANVSAYSLSAGLFGGVKYAWGPWGMTLTGRLGATKGAVAGFHEKYLGLGRQGFTRVDAELGSELEYTMGAWTPNVSVRWRENLYQRLDPLVANMNGARFTVESPKWARHRVETGVGVRYGQPQQPWSVTMDVRKAWLTKGLDRDLSVNLSVGYRF